MDCCTIVILLVIGFGVLMVVISAGEAHDERAKKNAAERARIDEKMKILRDKQKSDFECMEMQALGIEAEIKRCFDTYHMNLSYASVNEILEGRIELVRKLEKEMQERNKELNENGYLDEKNRITSEASNDVSILRRKIDLFKQFQKKVYSLPYSSMMDESIYGKINKDYWDSIMEMNRDEVIEYIYDCEKWLGDDKKGNGIFEKIITIDPEKVLKCIWYLATEKTYSASDFRRAKNVFIRINRKNHIDVAIAELYAKKKIGGEDVLREELKEMFEDKFENKYNSIPLNLIASGFMWMNAYQSENEVLQYMLASGYTMTEKMQERLHALANGGGKSPTGFEVDSSEEALYFDVSALAWNDDEFAGFFENLAFQDKTLSYSLALRDENKDLFIAQGIKTPAMDDVLNKLKNVFEEEYGSDVKAKIVDGIALSGSGEEKIQGILVSTEECKQLGIMIHIAKIGKKLIIKFYTLFMPVNEDVTSQKQQAVSLHKKLSPSAVMWEGSLKDTMLMAVEQLLNSGEMVKNDTNGTLENGKTSDEPIF